MKFEDIPTIYYALKYNTPQKRLFINQLKDLPPKRAKEILKKNKINPKWFHIGATGSIINPETRPIIAKVSNLVRAGLALYGFSSSTFDKNLKPTLKLTTKIVQIKKVPKGEKLGWFPIK
mgnify:CR=1 FL=1